MSLRTQDERRRVLLAAAAAAASGDGEPMRLRITLEGRSYDMEVEFLPRIPEDLADSGMAIPDSVLLPPLLPDTREEDKLCRSPFAGAIVSVAVQIGHWVRQDDPVVIIDAMKMQTIVGAPVDGTVEEIMVRPGDAVKPGQILCRLV